MAAAQRPRILEKYCRVRNVLPKRIVAIAAHRRWPFNLNDLVSSRSKILPEDRSRVSARTCSRRERVVPYSDARSTNWAWHLVPFASEHKVAANMLKKLLVQGRPLAEHRYPELRYSPRMFLCDWISLRLRILYAGFRAVLLVIALGWLTRRVLSLSFEYARSRMRRREETGTRSLLFEDITLRLRYGTSTE